jgi:Flagellar capping protein
MVYSVYNYLAGQTMSKLPARANTHKRSELKEIYNNIINLNKNSPLYIIKLSPENQAYTINIKEGSINLQSALKDISSNDEDSVFSYKKAFSGNEAAATAEIVTEDYTKLPDPFQMKVSALATPQKNIGNALYSDAIGLLPGNYSFTTECNENVYEFQFNIENHTTNIEVQKKLANYINQSNIGLNMEVQYDAKKKTSTMVTESANTGNCSADPQHLTFDFLDVDIPGNRDGIVEFLGLDNVYSYGKNARFELNGDTRQSTSNRFTLNDSLTISLHSSSEDPLPIKYVSDGEKVMTSVQKTVDSYNHLIQLANGYPSTQYLSSKLIHDLNNVTSTYHNDLESCGLTLDEDGYLNVDDYVAVQAIEAGDMQKLFSNSVGFSQRLRSKTDYININPIEYVDKTIVTYPNTTKPGTAKSYITSMYSGLFFNYYC